MTSERLRSARVPPAGATEIPEADAERVARAILLDTLAGRARSRSELADKLAARGVPADVGQRLLDRFEEVGLVDDAAFARMWVEGRHRGKGLARRALAQELRRKGVEAEVAAQALDELEPDAETERARELVRRKLPSLRSQPREVATRRLAGMLARKGYPPGTAWSVVRAELERDRHDEADLGDDVPDFDD